MDEDSEPKPSFVRRLSMRLSKRKKREDAPKFEEITRPAGYENEDLHTLMKRLKHEVTNLKRLHKEWEKPTKRPKLEPEFKEFADHVYTYASMIAKRVGIPTVQKEIIEEREREICSLRADLQDLKNSRDNDKRIKDRESEICRLKREIQTLNGELQSRRQSESDQQTEGENNRRYSRGRMMRKEDNSTPDTSKYIIHDLKEQVEKLREESESAKQSLNVVKGENEDLKQQLQGARDDNQEFRGGGGADPERTSIIKKEKKIMTKLLKVESKFRDRDEFEVSLQKTKQMNLLREAQKLLDEYKQLSNFDDDDDNILLKRLHDSNQENQLFQMNLKEKEEHIEKLEGNLNDLREYLQNLETQNENSSTSEDEQKFISKLHHQEERLKDLEEQQKEIIVDAQSILDNLKKDQKTAIEKIETEKKKELDQLQSNLVDKDNEIDTLKGEVQKLYQCIGDNNQYCQNLLGKIQRYQRQVGNLQQQINMGNAGMQRMDEALRGYESKIRNMQLQIRDCHKEKERVSGVLQVCEIDRKSLQLEVSKLRSMEKRLKSVLVDDGSFVETNGNPREFRRLSSAQDVVAEQPEDNAIERREQIELENRLKTLFDSACAIVSDEKAKNKNEEVETELKMLHMLRDTLHQYYIFHDAKHQNDIENNDVDAVSLQVSSNIKEQFPNYTDECDELCQAMVNHEPSLWLAFGDETRGVEIDTEMFTFYKNSVGDKLDFVVWPALLLGPQRYICRKGIVKPITNES